MFVKMKQRLKKLLKKKVRDSGLLFTRDNIRIDYEFEYYDKGIYVYIEVWFNPEKKFGIKLRGDDNVNVYAYILPDSDDVKVVYIIHRGDGRIEDEQVYTGLTQSEKLLIREMANEISLAETEMTITEYCYEFEQTELHYNA